MGRVGPLATFEQLANLNVRFRTEGLPATTGAPGAGCSVGELGRGSDLTCAESSWLPRRPLNKSGVGKVGRALRCSSCTAVPVCPTSLNGMIDDIGASYEIATYGTPAEGRIGRQATGDGQCAVVLRRAWTIAPTGPTGR